MVKTSVECACLTVQQNMVSYCFIGTDIWPINGYYEKNLPVFGMYSVADY